MKRRYSIAIILLVVFAFWVGNVAIAIGGNNKPDQDCTRLMLNPDDAKPDSFFYVDQTKLPFDALPGTTTTRYWGVNDKAAYQIEVPLNWNGKLVLYCHGYAGEGPELRVTKPSNLRQYLVANGYAWAASSYSRNGYNIPVAVKDTHALGQLFKQMIGKPSRVYVAGHSMGGHITAQIIEEYPRSYDGALPMCGAIGGIWQYDYMLDYTLLTEALSGVTQVFPTPANYASTIQPSILAGLGSPFPTVLTPGGETFKNVLRQRSGGGTPIFEASFLNIAAGLVGTALDRTYRPDRFVAAGNVMGNCNTVYQMDADPALSAEETELNEMILRFRPDQHIEHPHGPYLTGIPTVEGTMRIPVLTLHDMGLYVPIAHEQVYARKAAINGNSGLLVQRAIRDYNHCGFKPEEESAAFADLVNWVENGVKPQGDNFLDPANVINSKFGCKFTLIQRSYDSSPWACSN